MNNPQFWEKSPGRNCQTFAADWYRFLTGDRAVEPYHLLNRVFYKPAPHLCLYETDAPARTSLSPGSDPV